ncbi:MAG: hypothetical protein J6T88_00900 [Bacteroidales bacterium]|nr:hypothetical protein [Bacteroidales bacterium]
MNKQRFFLFSLLLLPMALMLTSSSEQVPRFEDLYECYIIVDAEVSDYQGDDYEQIDYEEFLSAVRRARRAFVSFVPAKEVRLYDDEGVRYMMYISKSCRFLRIDSNYFKVSKRQSKRLKYLTNV